MIPGTEYTISLSKHDYKVLKRRIRQYHSLVKQYQNRPAEWADVYYQSVESVVKGITETHNRCSVREQNIIKLPWWQEEEQSDDMIAIILNRNELTLRVFREKILRMVAVHSRYIWR